MGRLAYSVVVWCLDNHTSTLVEASTVDAARSEVARLTTHYKQAGQDQGIDNRKVAYNIWQDCDTCHGTGRAKVSRQSARNRAPWMAAPDCPTCQGFGGRGIESGEGEV